MKLEFRTLNANEIDVRVGTSNDKGSTYLLYKDARVDMTLLDEVVGPMNWQREHEFKDGKLYCKISIYNEDTNQWVSKEDVGVESFSEAEKGQASDSFKRSAVNWGIGRELYTAPFIWLPYNKDEAKKIKLHVVEIDYNERREINHLVLANNKDEVVFEFPKGNATPKTTSKATTKEPKSEEKVVMINNDQMNEIYNHPDKYFPILERKGKDVMELTYEEARKLIEWGKTH
jgi:hypothetical protein